MTSRIALKAPKNQIEVVEKFREAFEQIKHYYMFMYEDENYLHFKHKLTRDYVAIRKEKL